MGECAFIAKAFSIVSWSTQAPIWYSYLVMKCCQCRFSALHCEGDKKIFIFFALQTGSFDKPWIELWYHAQTIEKLEIGWYPKDFETLKCSGFYRINKRKWIRITKGKKRSIWCSKTEPVPLRTWQLWQTSNLDKTSISPFWHLTTKKKVEY